MTATSETQLFLPMARRPWLGAGVRFDLALDGQARNSALVFLAVNQFVSGAGEGPLWCSLISRGGFCRQEAKLKRSRSQSHCLPSTWGPQLSGASPGYSHSWGWSLDIFPPGTPASDDHPLPRKAWSSLGDRTVD